MNKEIIKAVLERSNGLCEICGSSQMVQLHHIIGGNGKRKQHETEESVVALCWVHHHGTKGVHGREGKKLDRSLKIELQDKYKNKGYSEEEVRQMMGGKLY